MAAKKARRRRAKPSANYAKVRTQVFQLDELEPAPYNARSITAEALRGLGESLDRLGVLALPIVNVKGGKKRLVGGHQRVTALIEAGETSCKCIVVQLDEATERRANFSLNNPHIEGEFVPELTRALLDEIAASTEGEALTSKLRLDVLTRQVIRDATQTAAERTVKAGKLGDDDDVPYSQSSATSKTGTLYQIGDHLVYCGKLTKPGTLDAFDVEDCAMAILNLSAGKKVMSDGFIDVLLGHTLANTAGGIYVATTLEALPRVHARFESLGGHWSNTIFAYDGSKPKASDPYRAASVPIVYGWRTGLTRGFYGGRDQGNAWKLQKAMRADRLPVEAAVTAILNSTRQGERVLDVNVRHGETLIAAEKTGRRLIGICPSPRDLDRVRARWTAFTKGAKANWKSATKAA